MPVRVMVDGQDLVHLPLPAQRGDMSLLAELGR
jgi:hypothetical protein